MRTLHQLSITFDDKMLLLTDKIEKAYLVRYLNDEIPAIFFKLGAWRPAKLAHAYYYDVFSTLNFRVDNQCLLLCED